MLMEEEKKQNTRLAKTILGITSFLIVWQLVFAPKIDKNKPKQTSQTQQAQIVADDVVLDADAEEYGITTEKNKQEQIKTKTTEELLQATKSKRIEFSNEEISGQINLEGAVIDYVKLNKYFNSDKKHNNVEMLQPYGTEEPYYIIIGWLGDLPQEQLPNIQTIWKTDGSKLTPKQPITLSYDNRNGTKFFITLSIDNKNMIKVNQRVITRLKKSVSLQPFISLSRKINPALTGKDSYQGPIGFFDEKFTELPYKKLAKSKYEFPNQSNAWLGISDKYWLTSIITEGNSFVSFDYKEKSKESAFVKITSRGRVEGMKNSSGDTFFDTNSKVFIGAKNINTLENYSQTENIPLFSRSIDLGRMYFITKPILQFLSFINLYIHNYGISIMVMTIIIRLMMFPLARKSFVGMSKIKSLSPKLEEIKKTHKTKQEIDRATLALYKSENVNPLAGIMPLLFQIPVFFALYKALYVSIDLRHSMFIKGWIEDLSIGDPTSFVNLFGLLPFATPPFLKIGILPILMGFTMWLQQKSGPVGTLNKEQAVTMKFLPLIFTFLFANLPSGLLLYWVVSNFFSFFQQLAIEKGLKK